RDIARRAAPAYIARHAAGSVGRRRRLITDDTGTHGTGIQKLHRGGVGRVAERPDLREPQPCERAGSDRNLPALRTFAPGARARSGAARSPPVASHARTAAW